MDIKNLVKSASYLDFINRLDNLIFEILYSKENGYTILTSKEAINEAQNYILKFDNESSKIASNSDFSNKDEIINSKKQELIFQIQKHYKKELFNWIYSVYSTMKDNCILTVSINKNNPKIVSEAKQKAFYVLDWFLNIQNYNETDREYIRLELEKEFQEAIMKNDEDYISKNAPQNSDISEYMNLRNLVLTDEKAFLNVDLAKLNLKLSESDLAYFIKIQNGADAAKILEIKDEIELLNCAIEILEISDLAQKYKFIKQVNSDFELEKRDKKLQENEKIEIVKRRMNLYKNAEKYYKNKLC